MSSYSNHASETTVTDSPTLNDEHAFLSDIARPSMYGMKGINGNQGTNSLGDYGTSFTDTYGVTSLCPLNKSQSDTIKVQTDKKRNNLEVEVHTKTYVITIPRNTKRLDSTVAQLKLNGFKNIEIVMGYDGAQMTNEEIQDKTSSFCYYGCTKGIIGCGSSHIQVWNIIADLQSCHDNHPSDTPNMDTHNTGSNSNSSKKQDVTCECLDLDEPILILEDDTFVLGKLFNVHYDMIRDKIKNEKCMFALGLFGVVESSSSPIIDSSHSNIPYYLKTYYMNSGLGALVVSRRICQEIIKRIDKVNWHIDTQLFNTLSDYSIYTITPQIIGQTSFEESSINNNKSHFLSKVMNDQFQYVFTVPVIKIGWVVVNLGLILVFFAIVVVLLYSCWVSSMCFLFGVLFMETLSLEF